MHAFRQAGRQAGLFSGRFGIWGRESAMQEPGLVASLGAQDKMKARHAWAQKSDRNLVGGIVCRRPYTIPPLLEYSDPHPTLSSSSYLTYFTYQP